MSRKSRDILRVTCRDISAIRDLCSRHVLGFYLLPSIFQFSFSTLNIRETSILYFQLLYFWDVLIVLAFPFRVFVQSVFCF